MNNMEENTSLPKTARPQVQDGEKKAVIRWAECGDTPTESQRNHARLSGLYNEGDCILIWINEGDFCDLLLGGRLQSFPAGQKAPLAGLESGQQEGDAMLSKSIDYSSSAAPAPWRLQIWVIYQNGRPFDYRFSRASGYQRLKNLREVAPSGQWDVGEATAFLQINQPPPSPESCASPSSNVREGG